MFWPSGKGNGAAVCRQWPRFLFQNHSYCDDTGKAVVNFSICTYNKIVRLSLLFCLKQGETRAVADHQQIEMKAFFTDRLQNKSGY